MSTTELTRKDKALVGSIVVALLALVLAVGLLLREYGPGNMGNGFLQGAAVGLLGAGIVLWRVSKRPSRATTFERAWTQAGDERDDAVLTRALAVLGLLSFPMTGAAAIAVGLGVEPMMALTLLLVTEVVVGAIAFAVINRRS
ncbi:hypothetical protein PU560_14845 [Georgenia sp. 10Sc9-8]|uniref:DUF2178 domain-containing protein n=1 Tax=Georgenia halotolerans TaxID=3028317 RepID=A0ABT5U0M3_9MICO|nr:hypothetical protein [Georgenia halotolerans]